MAVSGFLHELKRRKVIRVAVAYVVVAWLLVQIAETIFEPLKLPEWSLTLLIVMLGLGFPIALVLAWAFELTPEGLVRDHPADAVPGEPSQDHRQPEMATDCADAPSIAVLPFEDMSEEKDQGYFCDGMADEILNFLTQVQPLRVASRTSSFQFKNKAVDIKEVGRQLNVKTVLEGSVRKQGNQLRILAQLISVNDGYHLWSERFQRNLEDVFLIQEEIAKCIVSALEVTLSAQERRVIETRSTRNIDAYEYYLRGWQFFHRTTRKDLLYAIDMFEKALAEDPNFSRAWAGIADAYAFLYLYFVSKVEYRDKASEYSIKALELCSNLAESHISRGMAHLLCHEFADAERELDKAIALAPHSYEAFYFYGRTCFHQGKYQQAAEMFEKASEVNPCDYQSLLLLPQVYRALGRNADAEQASRRGIKAAKAVLQLNPDDCRALYLGSGQFAQLGDVEEGRRWIEKALAINDSESIVMYNAACFYSLIGELDTAMDCLEKAVLPVTAGMANKEWLSHDPDLDPLRDNPRFVALIERLPDK